MPLLRHIFEETHPVCRKKVEFSGNVSSEEEEDEEEVQKQVFEGKEYGYGQQEIG